MELASHMGRNQADMSILKGADNGVQIHHAGIFADADVRIRFFHILPKTGQPVKPIDNDMLSRQVVQGQDIVGGQGVIGGHHTIAAFPEQRFKIAPGGMGPGTVKVFNHVQCTAVKVTEKLFFTFHDRFLDNMGILLVKGSADPGKQIGLKAKNGAHPQGLVQGVGFPAAGKQGFRVRPELDDAVQKGFPCRGQANAGGSSFKKFETNF